MTVANGGPIRIELITAHSVRGQFDCGDRFLNEYLRRFARQNDRRGTTARTYVAIPAGGRRVLGYYTVSAAQIAFDEVPAELRRRLPRYPVPAARIGELAVDIGSQDSGLGGVLLWDAMKRILAASVTLAIWAVIVDAIDERAASFYRHFGFELLESSGRTLFLTLKDVSEWMK